MKILLCDNVIEPNKFVSDVQVIRYDEQTFDELCEFIRQQIAILNSASEPIDFAIVLNGKLAEVFPFFEGTIVSDFFKEFNFASISFFGEYIDYFSTLQQELAINVYYTNKLGRLRRVRKVRNDANPPKIPNNRGAQEPQFFVGPLADPLDPNDRVNENLFNACNPGCPEDKYYFTYPDRVPPYYRLKGDLTIDNTNNYLHFIKLDNGLTFDGCGHTITLTSSTPVDNFKGLFGSTYNVQLADGANVSISNVTIKVNTERITLDNSVGWLCYYVETDGSSNVCCVIDNCHVCAALNYANCGLVGAGSFNSATNSKFTIQNSSFTGNIDNIYCGGMVGYRSFRENNNTIITIQNCHFIGNINGEDCGGMVGDESFRDNTNGTIITIQDCCYTGTISGSYNGGMTSGNRSTYPSFNGNTDTKITINGCKFIGEINGTSCGGIAGGNIDANYPSFTSNIKTVITVQDCSFSGKIYGDSNSGIIGTRNFYKNEDTTITIQCCSATGDMTGNSHGGIVGFASFNANGTTKITIQECRFVGDIIGLYCGGITGFSGDSGIPSFAYNTNTSIITIQNCSAIGDILGSYNSGIIGACSFHYDYALIVIRNCSFSGNVSGYDTEANSGIVGSFSFFSTFLDNTIEIYNCLISGNINTSSWGGIAGDASFIEAQSKSITIHDCYSFCNFTVHSDLCGGILGPFCGPTSGSAIYINNCYLTGTNLGPNINSYPSSASFAILGLRTANCIVSNCVYNSYYQTTDGPKENNSYKNVIGTSNITGLATCNNPNTVQISYTQYECQLHQKLLNPELYQKQNKKLNIVAAFSICAPLAICNILTFVIANVCRSEHLYIYSKDMKFKSQLYWDNNNLLYNGTLASGTYIIAAKKH